MKFSAARWFIQPVHLIQLLVPFFQWYWLNILALHEQFFILWQGAFQTRILPPLRRPRGRQRIQFDPFVAKNFNSSLPLNSTRQLCFLIFQLLRGLCNWLWIYARLSSPTYFWKVAKALKHENLLHISVHSNWFNEACIKGSKWRKSYLSLYFFFSKPKCVRGPTF